MNPLGRRVAAGVAVSEREGPPQLTKSGVALFRADALGGARADPGVISARGLLRGCLSGVFLSPASAMPSLGARAQAHDGGSVFKFERHAASHALGCCSPEVQPLPQQGRLLYHKLVQMPEVSGERGSVHAAHARGSGLEQLERWIEWDCRASSSCGPPTRGPTAPDKLKCVARGVPTRGRPGVPSVQATPDKATQPGFGQVHSLAQTPSRVGQKHPTALSREDLPVRLRGLAWNAAGTAAATPTPHSSCGGGSSCDSPVDPDRTS